MGIADQIVQVESGGNPNARNPNSSAGGLGQFIDSTWLNTLKKHRPDLVATYSPSELLAMKGDRDLSKAMTDAYASDNAAFLRSQGHEPTPGNVYLAHFAGPQGAAKLLGAAPDAPVSSVMTPDAIKANPFLQKMTVADIQRWADRKMGAGGTVSPASGAVPAAVPQGSGSVPAGATAMAPGDSFSQFAEPPAAPAVAGAAPTGAPSAAAEPQQSVADPLGALPGMLAQQQQPQKFLPIMSLDAPLPPGIARARALARAMAQNPIQGVVK